MTIRKKLNLRSKYSMPEVAAKVGLPVDYMDLPAKHKGFIDPMAQPRFIAVNRGLPSFEQTYVIARHLAFRAQQLRMNSLIFNKPWKWRVLDAAPPALRERLLLLDEMNRAHWSMTFFSSGDDFRSFTKQHFREFVVITFADNIVGYHLTRLRTKFWVANLIRRVATFFRRTGS
jgi:hypothetical protein